MNTDPTTPAPRGVIPPKGMKYTGTHMMGGYPQHCFIEDKTGPTPSGPVKSYARNQKCGCVVCICEDEVQCQGCGATHCGTHPIGEIPDPIYDEPTPTPPQPAPEASVPDVPTPEGCNCHWCHQARRAHANPEAFEGWITVRASDIKFKTMQDVSTPAPAADGASK